MSDVVPDRIRVIEAWRAWIVSVPAPEPITGGDTSRVLPPQLRSLNSMIMWPARKRAVAVCNNRSHPAPDEKCSCGFYGVRTHDQVRGGFSSDSYVHGRVALWGEVIEHEHGFRAQYAYPLELWITGVHAQAGWALEQHYGVPVHVDTPRGTYVTGQIGPVGQSQYAASVQQQWAVSLLQGLMGTFGPGSMVHYAPTQLTAQQKQLIQMRATGDLRARIKASVSEANDRIVRLLKEKGGG